MSRLEQRRVLNMAFLREEQLDYDCDGRDNCRCRRDALVRKQKANDYGGRQGRNDATPPSRDQP
ncbi:hypothetical protein ACFWYW_27375 [Nonomuraea sp. NPDC059023]|uniref:hypothetical protein n=1 Tax=unclassified Nonomuraea TaxID=2593643 RepID=UPI00369B7E95